MAQRKWVQADTGYILLVRIVASDNLPKTDQAVIYTPADEAYIQEKIEWPAPRFTDNGDGTVTDSLTGLMWLKDGGCLKKGWNDALNSNYRFQCQSSQIFLSLDILPIIPTGACLMLRNLKA